jgi:hypothetical protein
MPDKHNITLAYTGAGGTIYRTLLKLLSGDDRVEHINVVASPNGRKLLQLEWGVEKPCGHDPGDRWQECKEGPCTERSGSDLSCYKRLLSGYGRHHSAPCCRRIVPHRIGCCNRSH